MTGVGIVGAGISGLTLALRLQQLGVATTLYSEGDAADLGRGRLPNTVGRMGRAQDRERELGSLHFLDPGCLLVSGRLSIKGDPPLEFTGRVTEPFHGVDFRVLLPALMDDYTSRGGRLVVDPLPPDAGQVAHWSRDHELMVVATGRRSVRELFPRVPAWSPYEAPQRILAAGLFHGFDPGPAFGFNISPGCGEILCMAMMTRSGVHGGVLIEAIPGGPLDVLARVPADEFCRTLLALLPEHAPRLAELIDPVAFELLGPEDLLQGAITPVVREAVAELPGGGVALAIGDAWVTNDPITGQGANLGSACAWIAAEAIAAGGPYDAAFARETARRMWVAAEPVVAWTNAFLRPPAEHVLTLLAAAATRQEVADLVLSLFGDPARAWRLFSSAEEVSRVVDGTG